MNEQSKELARLQQAQSLFQPILHQNENEHNSNKDSNKFSEIEQIQANIAYCKEKI